jgi:hypothetical protein
LLAIVLLVLVGCSPRSGVAVGPTETAGVPRAYVTRCEDDAVTSVRLTRLGPDEGDPRKGEVVLWQIEARPGQPLDFVAVGEVPPGFVVVVPARLPLSATADLGLIVNSDGEDDAFFRLSDLRPGKVYWDGRQVSLESFRHDAYYGGKCASEPIPIGFEYAALGLSVVTAATIIGLVLRRRRH